MKLIVAVLLVPFVIALAGSSNSVKPVPETVAGSSAKPYCYRAEECAYRSISISDIFR